MRPPRAGPHGVYCLHGDSKADCAGAEVIGRPAMERERPREDGTPQGSALTEQALLHSQGELPGSNGETPFNVAEMSPCHRERSPCMAETPGEMPPSNAEMEPCLVEMPPCHGEPGGSLGELLPCVVEMLPSKAEMPEEQPRLVSRGKCLVHNWQEERATNELDQVPSPELGSEGFFYRHGHHGLLTLQLLSQLVDSTTMKDSYRRPRRTGLPVRGQREAMLELMLYQKYRAPARPGPSRGCPAQTGTQPGGGYETLGWPRPRQEGDPDGALPSRRAHGVALHHPPALLQGGLPARTAAPQQAPRLSPGAAPHLLAGERPPAAWCLQHPYQRHPL
uniref:Sperm-associated antigen 8 n=1 Tax=Chrysemys picta bellii TaxID=8478 RepID=A0A8C3FBW6_CHRPI